MHVTRERDVNHDTRDTHDALGAYDAHDAHDAHVSVMELPPPLRRRLAPLVAVAVGVDGEGHLVQLRLNPPRPWPRTAEPPAGRQLTEPAIQQSIQQSIQQVQGYLEGRLRRWSVPYRLPATTTAFARAVLQATADIPYGATRTYGELARAVDRPGAARAVGQVMGRNPLPLVIPCHRVVASGGRLGGFTGGLDLKRALLDHEGAFSGAGSSSSPRSDARPSWHGGLRTA